MSGKFEVGGYAFYSWGYGQTNIDWFKVVRHNGKSVWFEAIQSEKHYEGSMHGYSRPADVPRFNVKYEQQGEEWVNVQVQEKFRKVVKAGYKGEIASGNFGNIYPWDGHPKFFSEWH
jgi:hypothetical protein